MDIVEISGISLTILGVVVTGAAALHQYQKNKKLENRLEEKENLREFAKILEEINNYITGFRDDLSNSAHGSSVWYDSRDFSKEYLSRKHLEEAPEIQLSVFQYKDGGKRVRVHDPDEFIRTIKSYESVTISLEIKNVVEDTNDQTFVHLDEVFSDAMKYIFRIQGDPPEYLEYMEKFSPELLDDLEECIDGIIKNCVEQAFANEPNPDINLEEYDNIDEAAESLINSIIYYGGLEDDLEELSEIIEEIDDVRKRALQTSYS